MPFFTIAANRGQHLPGHQHRHAGHWRVARAARDRGRFLVRTVIKQVVKASEEDLQATTLAAQVAAEPHPHRSSSECPSPTPALFAGTSDARLFWMDDDGQFTTRGDPPDWLADYNEPKTAESVRNAPGRRSARTRTHRPCAP